MADQEDSMNEEQWLYGDSTTDNLPTLEIKKEAEEKQQEEPPAEPVLEPAIPEANSLNSEVKPLTFLLIGTLRYQ